MPSVFEVIHSKTTLLKLRDDQVWWAGAVGRWLVMPAMRQVWTHEYKVVYAVRLNAITNKAGSFAAYDPRQLVFRMIVPSMIVREPLTGKTEATERTVDVQMNGFKTRIH